eukprot:m.3006 g.3006  ORF g.3006 m.3006 type:complete len:156 (+) comp4337_c0_seq1:103-570(+)
MANFDESSGVVECATPWGSWYQTIEEVVLLVQVQQGTRGKDISVTCTASSISVKVQGVTVLKGQLHDVVVADDMLWTVEDSTLLRIVLVKSTREAGNTWPSLLKGQYTADASQLDEMQKKMTLERFQRENPGFDFSGADISGQYQQGGPKFPTPS